MALGTGTPHRDARIDSIIDATESISERSSGSASRRAASAASTRRRCSRSADASNDDPYATKPAPGHKWIDTGPHVMIFNPGAMAESYPKTAGDPKKPYVMWPGTPYQHLMIPVR